jgi:hypothetical protein
MHLDQIGLLNNGRWQIFRNSKGTMYDVQIDWSYMNVHKIIALVFILLGGFILYRNIFHTR